MRRGKKGGLSNLSISIIWFLIIAGVILAVFQATGATSIDEAVTIAKDKAAHYSECIPSGECGLISILKGVNISNNPSKPSNPKDNNNNIDEDDLSNEEMPNDEIPNEDFSNEDINKEFVNRETKGYRGPSKGEPYVNNAGLVNKSSALEMLDNVSIVDKIESTDVKYSRAEWKHWSTAGDRACWSVRNEVLNRDAKPGTVVYVDKKMNSTINYDEACAIGRPVIIDGKRKIDTQNSGEWIDPYSGKKMTTSSDIDIDHVIPLSYAAKSGGQNWNAEEKEIFANDLDNLLATSAKENRSKGDKGPSKYMPSYKTYRCQYAKTFVNVSQKYNLTIEKSDYETLKSTLETCQY